MNRDILQEILNCPALPSLPQVALRVIELSQKENTSCDELARVIEHDQGLAAKILRTANSSFYGLRRPCATVNQAVVMLGFSSVKSLALGFSLVGMFTPNAASTFDYTAYWRRGLYTAVAARRIAAEAGRYDGDEAFLGGLLQDIGMMAMYRALGERYLRVLDLTGNDHRTLVRFELSELEVQHPEVGALLARRWKLPDALVMPIKYHERPTAAPAAHAVRVRCVGLANTAHDALTMPEPASVVRRFRTLADAWFGIDARRCDQLLHRIAEDAAQISDLFRLDTGPGADAEQILRDAAAALPTPDIVPPEADDGVSLGGLLLDAEDTDPLTGALNRAAFLRKADAAMSADHGNGPLLAVLAISIDGFAGLVATRGVEAADVVLAETAKLLAEHVDPLGGFVCRWDQHLFAACIPAAAAAAVMKTADEVRAMIEEGSKHWRLTPEEPLIVVTASVGAAVAGPADAASPARALHMVASAVRASSAAAAAGGNRVRSSLPRPKAA